MRLLILSHNYAPEAIGIGPYTTELADHFASAGHSVTVLTTFPHYPRYRWQGKPGLFRREQLGGVMVRRWRVVLPRRSTAMWRIVFDSSVGLTSLLNSVALPRPNLIIGVIPTLQNGFAAGLLSKIWQVPAILLVKDLPIEAGLAVGMLNRGFIYRAGAAFERLVYRMADREVVIGDQFRNNLIAKGIAPEAIAVIPDWVDTARLKPASPDPTVRRNLTGSDNGFLVVHAGAMGEKQGLHNVVAAATRLADDGAIYTLLVGDGPTRSTLEAQIQEHQSRNIQLLGVQPADYFFKILCAADALLINQRAGVVDAVVPSKLLTYMAAGKPIIAAVNSASVAARLIAEAGCGVLVPPEDPAALADAIRALRANGELRARLGQSGRQFVKARFDKTVALRSWDEFVNAAVTHRTATAAVVR